MLRHGDAVTAATLRPVLVWRPRPRAAAAAAPQSRLGLGPRLGGRQGAGRAATGSVRRAASPVTRGKAQFVSEEQPVLQRPSSRLVFGLACGAGALAARRFRRVARRSNEGRAAAAPPPEGAFVPFGCDSEPQDAASDTGPFEATLEEGFWCPPRLVGRDAELIEEVNLWHYSMLNDESRNQFFWDALQNVVKGQRVLDLGSGSGLLSMMAAKLGASSVVGVEANSDMVGVAELNIVQNKMEDVVQIVHSLSTSLECMEEDKVDVIVTETLGTLLNGESIIDYLADARERLAVPSARLVPAGGAQCCVLVMSETIDRLTSIGGTSQQTSCHGLDLSAMNSLRDTAQAVSPNAWGLRLAGLSDLVLMSERLKLYELDFSTCNREDIPEERVYPVQALRSGVVHAVVATWEVWGDPERTTCLNTHLYDPADGDESSSGRLRDSHFSQAVQLLEDVERAAESRDAPAVPFLVQAGEALLLRLRHDASRTHVQFDLQRAPRAG